MLEELECLEVDVQLREKLEMECIEEMNMAVAGVGL